MKSSKSSGKFGIKYIQDFLEFPKYPNDEHKLFTPRRRDWALALLERVLTGLNDNFPRPKNLEHFATKLIIPIVA